MKKKLLLVLMLLTFTVTITACGNKTEASTGEFVFRIGTANGSLCMAPMHVAEDLGYFDEEFEKAGIKYELVEIDVQQAADLIAAGKIDGCVGLAGGLIPQIDSGLEIAFTTGMHTGCTKYYVKKDSDIKSVEELKGKKIGVPGLSDPASVALKRKLADYGIGVSTDNMEIELIAYNMTDLALALENGAVDAIALHDPVATNAENEYGFTKILDLTEDEKFANEYCCTAYVKTDIADKYPEACAAYTRAVAKGSAYVQANPEETAKLQIENKHCSGDAEYNAKLLASYNYQPSVSAIRQTFINACEDLKEIGDLKTSRDIEEFADEHVKEFEGVPDSYIYKEDGTFEVVNKKMGGAGCCQ